MPEFDAHKSLIMGETALEMGTIMAQAAKIRTVIVHLRRPPNQ